MAAPAVAVSLRALVLAAGLYASAAYAQEVPPPAYQLVGLSIAATRPIGRDRLHLGVRADNLLNTAYRDLLDRFRYYTDARGRDITLWITYAFGQR